MLSTLLLALAPASPPPPIAEKRAPELVAAIESAPADRRLRVYAVLEGRLPRAELLEEVEGLPRGERARRAARVLQSFAAERQRGLLGLLDELERAGDVARVEPLWIANAVAFEGTPAALAAVAARADVVRLGWDPVQPPGASRDAPPPAPPATPPPGAPTVYYSQGFEGGVLPPELSVATTSCGYVEVTDQHGPASGAYHLVMAADTFPCDSTASFTLSLDLSGASTVRLRQRFKDMLDEFTLGDDVLEASDDGGASWTKVADLTGQDGTYVTQVFDLDPLGLDYGPDFRLRWSWRDNSPPEADGFAFDDIELADDFGPPPVPDPEPNLVGHQAPALWDLGYDGEGVVILCIDDGVDDAHPDLAGAVWANPLDPVDGLDNDGNGYVDDHAGWDFVDGDADPDPGIVPHGTSSAGILVGDGTSGVALTGMAPGARLAVARIDGQVDHWLALQWGVSVGVDVVSSSHSYKWYQSPPPDYAMHRAVSEAVLAAGIVHANSIGNDGEAPQLAPVPFNVSAPGSCPGPWVHPVQTQEGAGAAAVLACGAILMDGDVHYGPSGSGPSAWEDLTLYDPGYAYDQDRGDWDYPVGGFGGAGQGLLKPDLVAYTGVRTTTNGGGFTTFAGTSASTPHVGGALALLVDAQPHAAPRHLAQALQVTAVDLGAPGKDPLFGAGKLQVLDAAKRLLHLVRATDVTPSLGSELTLELHGFPGEAFRTYVSTAGPGATPLGGLGVLDLAPPAPAFAGGVLDADGRASLAVDVPPRPALVGVEVWVQSVADDRGGPTGELLFSTVERVSVSP